MTFTLELYHHLAAGSLQSIQLIYASGIIVDFGKKSTLKKHPSKEKKVHFKAKKAPILQKKGSRKKTLSKHYFINKKQQESTYN